MPQQSFVSARHLPVLAVCAVSLLGTIDIANAVPYASGVERVGDTVSFILNEPADVVTITRDGGNAITLSDAASGQHTFDMTGFSDYTITVSHSAPAGWTESSTSIDNPMLGFERANGVAVNQNPGSPNFGRFYVSQRDSTVTYAGRQMGDGIYVFNADATDAFGITDPNDTSAARTAGIDFSNSDSSPFRLAVGEDDTLYISDASDIHGGIYYTDPDVSTGGNLLAGLGGMQPITDQNHGSIISTPLVSGSLAGGDLTLYTIDQDLPGSVPDTGGHVWRYDIGGVSDYDGTPTLVVDASTLGSNSDGTSILSDINNSIHPTSYTTALDADITIDPRTNNFIINEVGGGIIILDPTATTILFNSRQYHLDNIDGTDVFSKAISVSVSPDGKQLVYRYRGQANFIIAELDENGIPILDASDYPFFGLNVVTAPPTYYFYPRGPITHDLAGNIYTAGNLASGGERLGIYSPGGDTIAVTRSNGSFTINGTTYGDYLPGDLDGDGFVGLSDLDIVLQYWNQDVTAGVLLQGDIDGDGYVGLGDLDVVLNNWNAGTPPRDMTDIPEPTAMSILMVAGIGLLNRRSA